MKYIMTIIVLLIFNQVDAKNKIYKWTDEDGNIHYTEKKPQDKQSDEVKVYNSKPTPLVKKEEEKEQQSTTDEELTPEQIAANEYNQAEQKRVQKIQDQENCKIAKKNKISLEQSVYVKIKNSATGEYVNMTTPEVKSKLKELDTTIKKLCK